MAQKFGIEQNDIQTGLPIRPQYIRTLYDVLTGEVNDDVTIDGRILSDQLYLSGDETPDNSFNLPMKNAIIDVVQNAGFGNTVSLSDGAGTFFIDTGSEQRIDLNINTTYLSINASDELEIDISAITTYVENNANIGGGQVDTVSGGANITVTDSNTSNPIVNLNDNISINNLDVKNQVVVTGNISTQGTIGASGDIITQGDISCNIMNCSSISSSGNISSQGDIIATGDVIANSSSDIRLKNNVTNIDPTYALESLTSNEDSISGIAFQWNDNQDTYEVSSTDIGVVAQEVEKWYPEIVSLGKNDTYKRVNYPKLVPVLIQAIRKQQEQIDELFDKIYS